MFCFVLTGIVSAQEINETITATWANDAGADNSSSAVISIDSLFSTSSYIVGDNLTVKGTGTDDSLHYVFTKYQPSANVGQPTEGYTVTYSVNPVKGLDFKLTGISFNTTRFGTDGGTIDVAYVSGSGEEISVATGIIPKRSNRPGYFTQVDLSVKDAAASEDVTAVKIYIYTLGETKQFGLNNVILTGTVTGTIEHVEKYTLSAKKNIDEAGSITVLPQSESYESGYEIKLSAEENFGYDFKNWSDTLGNVLSEDPEYKLTISSDTGVVANFEKVNTYALNVTVDGCPANYMVSASPAGYENGEGVPMYEEGTVVTLTANNNKAYTFTNWDNGQTGSDLQVTMDKDVSVIAYYDATDFIVGWDFHKSGNNGRVADFYTEDENQGASLVIKNDAGTTSSWLDKSSVSTNGGGYEGSFAAVNWNLVSDKYYYQISFNAKNYEDIVVSSEILCNYNAYSITNFEYSLDGTDFVPLDTFEFKATKVWYENEISLPDTCDHADKIYFRWHPDFSSPLFGSASTKDGYSLSKVYVFASAVAAGDSIAPVLTATVPAESANNASSTGKIILKFNEKVQIAEGASAVLGNKSLVAESSGKSLSFEYSGLNYDTEYTFTFDGNLVSDLSGNARDTTYVIMFKTMKRTSVEKSMYDFVVDGTDGKKFADAIAAANANTLGRRYRIFVKNGTYNLGNGMTHLTGSNVSIIGESEEKTILYNTPDQEGISVTATLCINSGAINTYLQDITLKNAYEYSGTTGRAVALQDKGDKSILKNVKLLSFQDTYYSNNNSMRCYMEDCEIHGTVDFICGGGDIFFNRALLFLEDRGGNCITAPSGNTQWGYVFSNCTIDGYESNNSSYSLGRPWHGEPRAVYLNTTMKVLPTAEGWANMSQDILPALFAEYKSVTASGSLVDLISRKKQFAAGKVSYNPVLTDDIAAKYTIENVLGGNDQWTPEMKTEQEMPLSISNSGNEIKWNNSKYAICYALCKNGAVVDFTTDTTYVISDKAVADYTVRSANEMGGLGESSNVLSMSYTALDKVSSSDEIKFVEYYTINGMKLRSPLKDGVTVVRYIYEDGTVKMKKVIMTE